MARLKVPVSRRTKDEFTSAFRPSNEAMGQRHWVAGSPDTTKAQAKLGQYQGNVAPRYHGEDV